MLRPVRKDALVLFCFLVFAYAYFYHEPGTNGNSRFSLIFAMVKEGHLYIDNFYKQNGLVTYDVAYVYPHYYSDKAIGPAVIGAIFYVPFYWMKRLFNHPSLFPTKMALTFLVIGLPSAIAGTLLYILCFHWSQSRFRAFLVTMTITMGTMYLPFSAIFFSHQFTAALLFCAFFLIYLLKVRQEKTKSGHLFLIGLLPGFAVIGDFPSALIALPLGLYYLSIVWRNPTLRRLRSLARPMLGVAIPAALQLVYNKLCFGHFLEAAYANEVNPYYYTAMRQGVMGIRWPDLSVLFYTTFHPLMGIFWQSPALLLAFIGAGYMIWKRIYREEAILAAWIILSYLVIMSGYYMWWGGASFGPRHLVPMLPYFCVFLTFIPRRLNPLFLLLSLVSVVQMTIPMAGGIVTPEDMALKIKSLGYFAYSNIYNYCLKLLEKDNFAHNWGDEILKLHSWGILIPWVMAITAVTVYFIWNPVPRPVKKGLNSVN